MLRAPATSVPHVIVARETGIEGIIGEAGVRAVTSVAIRCLIGGTPGYHFDFGTDLSRGPWTLSITGTRAQAADAGTIGLQLTRRP